MTMKLGDVLKKERERKGLSTSATAEQLGVSLEEYEAIEAGENASFDAAASLVLSFNEMIEGQVSQLYYPCGLPFTEVTKYDVR